MTAHQMEWPAQPDVEQVDALRATLMHAARRYALYREHFEQAAIGATLIDRRPLEALARLPLFQPEQMSRLTREAITTGGRDLAGVEMSSGTTGGFKRRVLNEEDLLLDAALLTRLLQIAGVRPLDRVAAVDWSVQPLSAAFLEAAERLGAVESVALGVTARVDLSVLRRLAPSVVIGPPALLAQVAPRWIAERWDSIPRLVIYNGDRLDPATAALLSTAGAGARSLYGLTETSALGVECAAMDGVHLAPDCALFELRSLSPGEGAGRELIVTTLGFSMPLLRYPTGDRVRMRSGRCACGLTWPRVEIQGRLGGRFALFDTEFTVEELRSLLGYEAETPFQVELTKPNASRQPLTLHLPAAEQSRQKLLRDRLRGHPLLDYLLRTRLVTLRLRFDAPVMVGRKAPPLIDRRPARSNP